MKCKKCGVEIALGEKFCPGCGAKTEYADMKFGKIIIHRKSNFYGCAIPFKIFIDEREMGTISNGETLTFDVPFGTHQVYFNKIGDKENREVTLSENKGEIKFTISTAMWRMALVAKAKIKKVE